MDNADFHDPYEFPISWDVFHLNTVKLAEKLMPKGPFKGIVAITRGGLIPASIIARELNIRVVESVGMKSYTDGHKRGSLRILKELNRDLVGDGEGWLVVDDLVDSGVTARAVKELIPQAHMATVYAKPEGQQQTDTFVVPVRQDVWLIFPWDARVVRVDPLIMLQDNLEKADRSAHKDEG
ncbi:MAG: xanthine phosphoribosyltransferase [Rhodospirillum sp.]|nr:xanthine phosphoribosyltransferase [Rhodospirillum sp.]MCF8491157.1 xanthine phosphoribosyltransferase [Rhodospirillum sp.]MCF8502674.1 xanthine phosphoribosyltransferase [Rhodospirillum sp.]